MLDLNNAGGSTPEAQEFNVKFDYHVRPSIPESEFAIRANGFPEPYWMKPKVTSWYLWLGLAGMLCSIVAGIIGWVRRRRAVA
jgi:hypothetical protein